MPTCSPVVRRPHIQTPRQVGQPARLGQLAYLACLIDGLALDEHAVAEHADAVAVAAGGIDIALNAVSCPHVQGTPLTELAVEEIMHPIDAFLSGADEHSGRGWGHLRCEPALPDAESCP